MFKKSCPFYYRGSQPSKPRLYHNQGCGSCWSWRRIRPSKINRIRIRHFSTNLSGSWTLLTTLYTYLIFTFTIRVLCVLEVLPFLYNKLLYEYGQYFLDIQHTRKLYCYVRISCIYLLKEHNQIHEFAKYTQ